MFQCICCLKEFDDSVKTKEHIFPESIGGTICIFDICKLCNSHFGNRVDGPLINNFLIDSRRMNLGLKGKSGYVPNPIENGVMAEDPEHKVKFIIGDRGKTRLLTVPSVNHDTDKNGNQIISIKLDKSDEIKLPKILEKVKNRLVRNGKQVEFKSINKQDIRIEKPWIDYKIKLNINSWQRGIIKIAYELAYRYLGKSYLDDPIAFNLREILLLDDIDENTFKKYPILGSFEIASNKGIFLFLDDPNSLYGVLINLDGKLICAIKILNVFEGIIVVTEHHQNKTQLEGNLIRIDVVKGDTVEIPFIDYLTKRSIDTHSNA